METASSFESLVYIYFTTRRHVPKDSNIHSRYRVNLKSEKVIEYRSDFVQETCRNWTVTGKLTITFRCHEVNKCSCIIMQEKVHFRYSSLKTINAAQCNKFVTFADSCFTHNYHEIHKVWGKFTFQFSLHWMC
jgi:hypothetical protein